MLIDRKDLEQFRQVIIETYSWHMQKMAAANYGSQG
jgi:hypothetical protein